MPPQIENPTGLDLSQDALHVLQRIFAGYRRVVLVKEFGVGRSGGRVFEVRPIKADGRPELPTVVKLASVSMIQQEWRAYQEHIHNRLPHVASVSARPTLHISSGWGGLRYPLVGIGDYDILSLHDFCAQPDVDAVRVQAVLERLLRIMDNIWGFHTAAHTFALGHSYDAVLPPNLLLQVVQAPPGATITPIAPGRLPSHDLQPGDMVSLAGFAVQKVDPARRTMTLRLAPSQPGAPAFVVRLRIAAAEPMPDYRAQQIVDLPVGQVIQTRQNRLCAELAGLGDGIDPWAAWVPLAGLAWLPNPLEALPELLGQSRGVNLATVHGDFNLENILVEPQLGDVSLIDFANARQDHVLHDLLHLEAEVLTHMLPGVIKRLRVDPALLLAELSWWLHQAMANPGRAPSPPQHPELHKLWTMLWTIRRAARRYLFDPGDLSEYYQGLTLYLLGALRYRSLSERSEHPLPKQIAFWGAALAYYWVLHPDAGAPAALASLLERSQVLWADAVPHTNRAGDALALLPVGRVPPGGVLPPGSRLPLERNRRFVGRLIELERLAAGLRRAGSSVAGPALAVAGLGGIGKTQLACEFAFRFGRFFSGGVFWLACADPQMVAAEVAACGERGAMNLRPNFRELPLEQQVELVVAEWRKPIPRLLIFDNCEAPELLERWLPREGGCHALITCRRADWAALGIATLALDVLPRMDSLALLQGHQPDADSRLLGEIAHEVGDLPLALHLAGSYLARYRHNTDAAGYLAGLRQAPPLSHQSLQHGVLSPTEHDLNVGRTFALSYDQLDRDDSTTFLARLLIQKAACLAPGTPIPESLVRLTLAMQYANAAHIVRDGFELGSAVNQLVELGLARAEADRTLWFHRLVVAYTRERLGDQLEPTQALVERGLCIEAERLNAQRDPAQLHGWHVHLRFVADAALPRGDLIAADLCHALAEHLYQTGDYSGARAYHMHALSIRQVVLGAEHPATASSLTEIGKALLFYGDVALAQPYLERALAIQQAKLGDHEDAATTLNHLGFLFQSQNLLTEARLCHERALRIRRSVLGAQHPAIVESLCNLAYVEYAQGDLDLAHIVLQQALAVQRKATGDNHPETARVLNNLGQLFVAQGKHKEAEGVFSQALAIQEAELGAEHPETARTLVGLGDTLRLLGDPARARSCYERALRVFQICHGAEHFRTHWVQTQLAALSSNVPGSSSYKYPRSSDHY